MAIPKRKITKRHTNIPRNVNSGEKPLFSSKGTMSVNKNGVLQNKKGVVYMTETRVTDVDSIHYASKYNPAYTVLENGQISVFPAPGSNPDEFKV